MNFQTQPITHQLKDLKTEISTRPLIHLKPSPSPFGEGWGRAVAAAPQHRCLGFSAMLHGLDSDVALALQASS
ncbi:hypothetical protein HMPREF0671_04300 [Prevotella sp. S7 MS 2]|nr:hypothetical protein HMPREF0671_04300 [Prevotella sp. S7 MS 2]